MKGWRRQCNIEPCLSTKVRQAQKQYSENNECPTFTFWMISSFVASTSPLYTTLTTSGSVSCKLAIAVHRTRSPPPPALLYLSTLSRIRTANIKDKPRRNLTYQYGWKNPTNFFRLGSRWRALNRTARRNRFLDRRCQRQAKMAKKVQPLRGAKVRGCSLKRSPCHWWTEVDLSDSLSTQPRRENIQIGLGLGRWWCLQSRATAISGSKLV